MEAGVIRQKFLDFFKSKNHLIVPSAPLVLRNDPTLLFTNSGMVQFKDYFLGHQRPPAVRIADTQKCLRVSGKHNDLEEVGIDTYHHTMFEMLGNWSFGDYFKKEAIAWAWELLTAVYGLPSNRMYATVFGGDEGENLPPDEEAMGYWKEILPPDRILYGGKKDNFWEMGDAGPCGPCSEIHIDLRSEEEIARKPGRELVNADHPRVIEIWNLVFMEFNRKADGTLEKLPARHVDTGMGFERLCMAIQGKTSTYDTSVFRPLMDFIAQSAGVTYQGTSGHDAAKTDIAIRVLADHIRAVAFAIADGQLPSNTGAGYVIRRILRRAVRYGYTFLHFKEPFLHRLVPLLASQFSEVFPELEQQRDYVVRVILEEEQSFLRTLEKGLKRFEALESSFPNKVVPGTVAFELYDTYGFPFDLTALIAREKGLSTDMKGFEAEMEKQKERSRADAHRETGDWVNLDETATTRFVGYDQLEAYVKIIKYRVLKTKGREEYHLVFDKTPFYAESGGQVGDTGFIESEGQRIEITDTKKENELIVHVTRILPPANQTTFRAVVNARRREKIMNNHTATHLLHAALRQVLGRHVEQRGSLVNENLLRFDFSHFSALTADEIRTVEDLVNEKIRQNIQREENRNMKLEQARAMGAMALFGEKYGEEVRVIAFDKNFSVELCGGTHVPATGHIGLFKIISEGSVAAGVRRIEAVTGEEALNFLRQQAEIVREVKSLLKNPKDVVTAAKQLAEEKLLLEKKIEQLYQEQTNRLKEELAGSAEPINGARVIMRRVTLPHADALKNIAYALRNTYDDLLLVLAAEIDNKPMVAVMLGEKLAQSNRYHAGNMVKELAKEINGGGGGQPFFATAGGKDIRGLDRVLVRARQLLDNR
ncbi:MAG: alanine--tRNA ligase [Cyclobacteriaceae bacterium]|nr:MAG: alanine--tRNA ligase [Cyclobacteriaceae bacterium]